MRKLISRSHQPGVAAWNRLYKGCVQDSRCWAAVTPAFPKSESPGIIHSCWFPLRVPETPEQVGHDRSESEQSRLLRAREKGSIFPDDGQEGKGGAGWADVAGRVGEGARMVGWIQAQKLGDQCFCKVAGHLVRNPSKKVDRVYS